MYYCYEWLIFKGMDIKPWNMQKAKGIFEDFQKTNDKLLNLAKEVAGYVCKTDEELNAVRSVFVPSNSKDFNLDAFKKNQGHLKSFAKKFLGESYPHLQTRVKNFLKESKVTEQSLNIIR